MSGVCPRSGGSRPRSAGCRAAAVVGLLLTGLAVAACAGRARPPVPSAELPVRRLAAGDVADKFEAGFEARLRAAAVEERFAVLVDLTDQVDFVDLARRIRADRRTRVERRDGVVALFEGVAARQQARVVPVLEAWIAEGRLDYVRAVAIVNRLFVEGPAPGILALAELEDVARVLPDWHSRRSRSGRREPDTPVSALGERFESWGVRQLGAPRLWERGLDGRNVVVAAIDTGVYEEHEQLRGRRLEGPRGWFDPVRGSAAPFDSHGHGTGVLSQAVGGNPDGRVVGVAPAARWAMGLANFDNYYSRVRMTLAADWAFRVARPDVLVNAWSHDEGPCNDFDLPFINAWKAAGIFVVFSAGNAGPGPGTGEAPAQLGGTFPGHDPVFAVGAIRPDGEVYEDSSRGPSACGAHPFPRVVGPGARLPLASPGQPRAYQVGDGTSLTAGLVAGAAALLLQADPTLEPWELESVLVETARDLPPPGPDNASGAGALYLPAALERVHGRARAGSR